MLEKLTKRQNEVLREIKKFIKKEGISPSVRDLAGRLGKTPSTIHKLLRTLQDKGHIKLRDNISRGIVLTEKLSAAVMVPIIGRIPAGQPVFSEELYEGYIEVDSSLVPRGELFALRINGDSMVGANILDGDTAIIRKQEIAESGDIVAALVDGEATLKRFKLQKKKAYLCPENDNYEPIELTPDSTQVDILGKLVAVVRKY
ncbi:repressor LexA [bacterium]|nr:MAG: repressor LexA [bacterium]